MAVALGLFQLAFPGDDETEARHALDAFVGRGDHRLVADPADFERDGTERAHGIDQQLAAPGIDGFRNLGDRIEDAGTGLAMDGENMGDGRIGIEGCPHLVATRRQVVPLVDQRVGAAEILHGLRGAQTIGAVGENQHLAVLRHEGAEHRLNAEGTGALDRHAVIFALAVADQRQQAAAQIGGHRPEIAIPGPPVAQHRLLDGVGCGQRSRRQQIGLTQGRRIETFYRRKFGSHRLSSTAQRYGASM